MSRGKGRCFFFLLSMKNEKNPLNRINDTSYVNKKTYRLGFVNQKDFIH